MHLVKYAEVNYLSDKITLIMAYTLSELNKKVYIIKPGGVKKAT